MSTEKSEVDRQETAEQTAKDVAEEKNADGVQEQVMAETVGGGGELAEAREEVVFLRDRLLRMAAENENFKKRMERERLASLKYAGETIFREVLPVVDNLERATAQGVVAGASAEESLGSLRQGVELTLKSLLATLEKFEVRPLDSVGQPFDPRHQEALTMEASDQVPANHVLSEFEKGYYYKDRLLRAAKVVVSAGNK